MEARIFGESASGPPATAAASQGGQVVDLREQLARLRAKGSSNDTGQTCTTPSTESQTRSTASQTRTCEASSAEVWFRKCPDCGTPEGLRFERSGGYERASRCSACSGQGKPDTAALVAKVFADLEADPLAARDRARVLLERSTRRGADHSAQAQARRALTEFVRQRTSCYIFGPTGTGKSWLLEHAAIASAREGQPTRYLTEATLTEAHRARFAKGSDPEAVRLRGWGDAVWSDAKRVQFLVLDEFALRAEPTDAYLAALEAVIDHRWTCNMPTAFGSNHHVVAPMGTQTASVNALRGPRIASRINGMVGGLAGGRLVYLDGQDLRGMPC